MNKLIFGSILALLASLMLPTQLIYAGGPRFDSPEGESDFVQDCYRDGYESGFAHVFTVVYT
jgi:hypothetical protein